MIWPFKRRSHGSNVKFTLPKAIVERHSKNPILEEFLGSFERDGWNQITEPEILYLIEFIESITAEKASKLLISYGNVRWKNVPNSVKFKLLQRCNKYDPKLFHALCVISDLSDYDVRAASRGVDYPFYLYMTGKRAAS